MTVAARQASAGRRAMLAKVHLGAKELGLDDDQRRDVLERLTGRRSSADCTDAQLDAVIAEFKRLGWKPKISGRPVPRAVERPSKPVRAGASSPIALKARALWISLWQLGVVRSPDEAALEAFAKRQLGVEKLEWADAGKAYRLIEALKAMALRAGWEQDPARSPKQSETHALKCALLRAQSQRLQALNQIGWTSETALITHLCRQRKARMVGGLQWLQEAELDGSVAYLGEWIRRAQAEAAL